MTQMPDFRPEPAPIKHETELPFCHWLPLRVRDLYATAFGRRALQSNNLFWSPFMLFGGLRGFRRTSRFLQFGSYGEYQLAQTRLAPRRGIGAVCQAIYFAAVARCGRYAVFFLPNLASTFRRR